MVAWGFVTGMAMVQVGVHWLPSLAMTFAVYSGTSQLTVLPMLTTGAGVLAMIAATAVANLRFVVYSAVMSRHLRRLPLGRRLLIGYFTIDGPVAAFVQRQQQGPFVQRVSYLVGGNVVTAIAWCGSTVLGLLLALVLPTGLPIAYLGVLALFALTLPMLNSRPAWVAAAATTVVAIWGVDWPHRLGTFVAVLAGVAMALIATRMATDSAPKAPAATGPIDPRSRR